MNSFHLTGSQRNSRDAYLHKQNLRHPAPHFAANVGLSSTISADRNIPPPWQIDIKVITGAVIT